MPTMILKVVNPMAATTEDNAAEFFSIWPSE
jgi:hypothetical protein